MTFLIKNILFTIAIIVFFAPSIVAEPVHEVFADSHIIDGGGDGDGNGDGNGDGAGNDDGGGDGGTLQSGLTNPLESLTITAFLLKIIEILIIFAIPIIILFIMYGGFLLVTAQGESSELTKGRNAILGALVGGVVILGAQLILTIIQGVVADLQL